jgi:hypothetical protein
MTGYLLAPLLTYRLYELGNYKETLLALSYKPAGTQGSWTSREYSQVSQVTLTLSTACFTKS